VKSILDYLGQILVDKLFYEIFLVGLIIFYLTIKQFRLEKELTYASIRAFIQLFAIAFVLGIIISIENIYYTVGVLAFMMAFAAYIARSRVPAPSEFYTASIIGISVASTIVIVYTSILDIFPPTARFLIPFGSMVIANCMNSTALGLDRLIGEIKSNINVIESKLALGVPANIAVKPHLRDSVRASLIPVINTLEALGLVWIPGTMSGMILGGADPIWAAQYQLFVSFSIFATNVISTLIATNLALRRIFTKNHQFNEHFLLLLFSEGSK